MNKEVASKNSLCDGKKIHVPENLCHLPRARLVFQDISHDPNVVLKLPPDLCTAGQIVSKASTFFEQLLQRQKPMKFMFGLTHDPVFRYNNKLYGYKYGKNKFANMMILYVSAEPVGPAFLEALLIDKFGRASAEIELIEIFALLFMNLRSCVCF